MKKIYLILALNFIIMLIGHSQKYDYNWMTGYEDVGEKYRINFEDEKLNIISDQWPLKASYGYVSVSNKNGELQFYSNGISIYNAEHELMINGDSINYGDFWESYKTDSYPNKTGYIILPMPGDINKYYLIYKRLKYDDNVEHTIYDDLLQFSIIDMETNGNKGLVVEKDAKLISDTLEVGNLTACRHANGRDWWMLIRKMDSNILFQCLIDNKGIHITDTLTIGVKTYGGLGQSVFTPDGTKFIEYNGRDQEKGEFLDIYDFDRRTGQLSNPIHFNYKDSTVWSGGVSVSPNSRFLYVANTLRIYQLDLWANDIIASIDTVGTYDGYDPVWGAFFGILQAAPDGKIYGTNHIGRKTLHIIHNPNEQGTACNFKQHDIVLKSSIGDGFPNMPHYRLGPIDGSDCDTLGIDNIPVAKFRYEQPDSTNPLTVKFIDLSWYEPNEWQWRFESDTSSFEQHPTYTFSSPGTYEVCLNVKNENAVDTLCRTLVLGDRCIVKAGRDSIFCLNNLAPNPRLRGEMISGFEPHQFEWTAFYSSDTGRVEVTVSDFIEDNSKVNPLINGADNLANHQYYYFSLKATDAIGNTCQDTVRLISSRLDYTDVSLDTLISAGDQVQLPKPAINGGIPPLRCQWYTILDIDDAQSCTPTVFPEESKMYLLISSDSVGCGLSAEWNVRVETVGTENIDLELHNFKVYPNPTKGDITLNFSKRNIERKITVMDTSGKILEHHDSFGKKLHLRLGNIPFGVYYLRVNEAGKSPVTKKIFISR